MFRRKLRQEGLKYTPERAQILEAIIRREGLFEAEALSILGVVFAYFFGTIARMALHWWTKGKQTHAVRGWQDIKALVVIAVLAYTAADYLLNPGHPPSTGLRNTTLGMVLFYFGSR